MKEIIEGYISQNKEAWEEAFEKRDSNWGIDIARRIETEAHPFLNKDLVATLDRHTLAGKVIAQFCCNNDRELLSIMQYRPKEAYGFDIAENQIDFASSIARELKLNCNFVACDILEIDKKYKGAFDYIVITIGAITWFRDLNELFRKINICLKKNGYVIINDMHPFTNMLAAPGEENYKEDQKLVIRNSYFDKIWIENDGIYYITKKQYKSKTFISFSHSITELLTALVKSELVLCSFTEYDYDISGLFEPLDHTEVPLSYILEAKK